MRFITRSALKRIALLFLVLAIIVSWCGCNMMRMPLKSFRGPLPVLSPAQTALREELRQHVEKLAGEIGE